MPVPAGCEKQDGEYDYYESIDHGDPNQAHIGSGSNTIVAVLFVIICCCVCSVIFFWRQRSNGKP